MKGAPRTPNHWTAICCGDQTSLPASLRMETAGGRRQQKQPRRSHGRAGHTQQHRANISPDGGPHLPIACGLGLTHRGRSCWPRQCMGSSALCQNCQNLCAEPDIQRNPAEVRNKTTLCYPTTGFAHKLAIMSSLCVTCAIPAIVLTTRLIPAAWRSGMQTCTSSRRRKATAQR